MRTHHHAALPSALLGALAATLVACAGAQSSAVAERSFFGLESTGGGATAVDQVASARSRRTAPSLSLAGGLRGPSVELDSATRQLRSAQAQPAQPAPPPPPPPRPGSPGGNHARNVPTNATPAPTPSAQQNTPSQETGAPAQRLVYTALLDLVVNDVPAAIARAAELVRAAGGYESSRRDATVTLRVPVERFREALAQLEALGDVSHRELDVEDVSEAYHDLEVRIANLRAVRQRLQELLARAANVTEALAVQRELDRVGMELEQLEGQLRFMANRVAFSTVTLRLAPRNASAPERPRTYETPQLNFPFPWLQTLGLPTLLRY